MRDPGYTTIRISKELRTELRPMRRPLKSNLTGNHGRESYDAVVRRLVDEHKEKEEGEKE